jgi:hypothetical protein
VGKQPQEKARRPVGEEEGGLMLICVSIGSGAQGVFQSSPA